jgi:predicted Zn-dependent protease
MVFGENPREGFFEGSVFHHPDLAFRMTFPSGWKGSNQKQAVGAVSPNEDAVVVLTLANSGSPQDAAREFYSQQGIQQGPAVRANLGGGAVANVFGVSRSQGSNIQGVAAFVEDRDKVYQILGYTSANNFQHYDDVLASAVGTFNRVTDPRLLDIQPRRVDVVKTTSAMSLEEFNRRYPSTVDIQTLGIINQADGNTRFPMGTEVKRVVGGEGPP